MKFAHTFGESAKKAFSRRQKIMLKNEWWWEQKRIEKHEPWRIFPILNYFFNILWEYKKKKFPLDTLLSSDLYEVINFVWEFEAPKNEGYESWFCTHSSSCCPYLDLNGKFREFEFIFLEGIFIQKCDELFLFFY